MPRHEVSEEPEATFQFKPSKLYKIRPDVFVPAIINLLICHSTLCTDVGEVFGSKVTPRPVHVIPKSSLYAIVFPLPFPTATTRLPL